jgi:hypothetical protein
MTMLQKIITVVVVLASGAYVINHAQQAAGVVKHVVGGIGDFVTALIG